MNGGIASPDFRYWCFISYSQADAKAAARIQRFLETYRLPRRSAEAVVPPPGLTTRIGPVFRDLTHLGAVPRLSEGLRDVLRASARLVVLCSPQAAASPWVNDEIAYFQSLGRHDAIYAVKLAGEQNARDPAAECMPPALRGLDRDAEPLVVDMRGGRAAFRQGCLRLVAGLHRTSLDDLVRRHARRQRRAAALSFAGALGVAALGTWAGLRTLANTLYASAISEARSAEAAGHPRAAETAIQGVPGWVGWLAASSYRDSAEDLARSLGFIAGQESLPNLELTQNVDPAIGGSLSFSGDFGRMAVTEFITTIRESVENDWLSVLDRTSGNRIARIFGNFRSPTLALNRDGTVFTIHKDGQAVLRSVGSGGEIARIPDEDTGGGFLFEAPTRDRLIAFTPASRHVRVFNATTGAGVAVIAGSEGASVQTIAYQDRVELRHMGVLFTDGVLRLVDLDTGSSVAAKLPRNGAAADLLWTSSARDELLVLTRANEIALYRGGAAEPVAVAESPIGKVAFAAALNSRRFAAVGEASKNEVVFFDHDDPRNVERHVMPSPVEALISSGGTASVLARLESGETYLVISGASEDVELFGRRMNLSAVTIHEGAGLYALGSRNGYFVIGNADTGTILREGRIGDTPVIAVLFDQSQRSVEIIGGDGRRQRHDIAPPRQVASWLVSDFTTLDGKGDDDTCADLAISPTGNGLAVRTRRGLAIYAPDGKRRGTFELDAAEDERRGAVFEFDPTGRWILFAYADQPISVIDALSARGAATRLDYPSSLTTIFDLASSCPRSFGRSVTWKESTTFMVKSEDGTRTWNLSSVGEASAPVLNLVVHDADAVDEGRRELRPKSVVAPAGDREVSTLLQDAPVLRRRSDHHVIAPLGQFGPYADTIAFSPNGSRVVIASSVSGSDDQARPNGGYALVDAVTGSTIREHREWIVDTSRVTFSPDGKHLLINARGGADFDFNGVATIAHLLDARSGQLIAELTRGFGGGHAEDRLGGYADTLFAPDGKRLYAVRHTGTVDVWSTE